MTTGSLDSGLASTDSPTSELEAGDKEVELGSIMEEEQDETSGASSWLIRSTTKVEMGMEARWLGSEEGGDVVTTSSMDGCDLSAVEMDKEGQSSLRRPIWLLGEEMEVVTKRGGQASPEPVA